MTASSRRIRLKHTSGKDKCPLRAKRLQRRITTPETIEDQHINHHSWTDTVGACFGGVDMFALSYLCFSISFAVYLIARGFPLNASLHLPCTYYPTPLFAHSPHDIPHNPKQPPLPQAFFSHLLFSCTPLYTFLFLLFYFLSCPLMIWVPIIPRHLTTKKKKNAFG